MEGAKVSCDFSKVGSKHRDCPKGRKKEDGNQKEGMLK